MNGAEGELPDGWIWSTVGDLASDQSDGRTIHQGWSPRCEKQPSEADSTWGVLKTTAIQAGSFEGQHNKKLPLSLLERPLLEVANGDLLLTCAGPRQRCGVATLVRHTRPKLMISGKMYRFRFDETGVLPEFVESYLLSTEAWQRIDEMKTGGSESGLNLTQSRFRTLPVPVPPMAEQERIVAAIEEHLSRLDAAVVGLAAALRRVHLLEQSVIDEAISGEERAIGSCLAEPLRNGYSASRSDDGDTRVLTLTAVTKRAFVEQHTKRCVVPVAKRDKLMLQPGDVLIQRSNTPELVGTAALYRGAPDWAVFPDLLIRVRPDESLLPDYLELALRTTKARSYFRGEAQGIAGSMPKISQSTIEACTIGVPESRAEQQRVVDAVTGRLEAATRLGTQAETGLVRARSFRRSVLAAAFSGRLVPQDSNDEPAGALLERIADERAAVKPTPKTRRTKASA